MGHGGTTGSPQLGRQPSSNRAPGRGDQEEHMYSSRRRRVVGGPPTLDHQSSTAGPASGRRQGRRSGQCGRWNKWREVWGKPRAQLGHGGAIGSQPSSNLAQSSFLSLPVNHSWTWKHGKKVSRASHLLLVAVLVCLRKQRRCATRRRAARVPARRRCGNTTRGLTTSWVAVGRKGRAGKGTLVVWAARS